jgi:hypothetical protein
MLDGNHHTDEICLKYGIGWTTLQVVLKHLGGGGASGNGDNRGSSEGGVGYGRGQSTEGGRRGSRDNNNNGGTTGGAGFDKSGYGKNVVMLWI